MTDKRPTLASALSYQNPRAALEWLEAAFGFEPAMVILDDSGALVHSEMRLGDGLIMVGSEWNERTKSPRSVGGACTQTVHVQLEADIDGHCERARKAGAVIQQEPQDQFYGDRTYRALDLEGHLWTFGQTVRVLSEDEWAREGGVTVRQRL